MSRSTLSKAALSSKQHKSGNVLLVHIHICYLPSGRFCIVKDCDRDLATGRGQYFQARGHSFSLYGPTLGTLGRSITFLSFFFPAVNWLTNGLRYATLSLNRLMGQFLSVVANHSKLDFSTVN